MVTQHNHAIVPTKTKGGSGRSANKVKMTFFAQEFGFSDFYLQKLLTDGKVMWLRMILFARSWASSSALLQTIT